jgi:hypothetical protein
MNPESQLTNLEDSSISLADAMDRTNFWRQTAKPLFNNDSSKVPKGFMIPIADITALADKYSSYNIVGVRAYLTILQPQFKGAIRAVLVPVTEEISADGKTIIYKDLILTDDEDVAGQTSIYDFTKPCPDSCDTSSPLF